MITLNVIFALSNAEFDYGGGLETDKKWLRNMWTAPNYCIIVLNYCKTYSKLTILNYGTNPKTMYGHQLPDTSVFHLRFFGFDWGKVF